MITDTTSQTFFENKYQQSLDPWAFASSDYELKRYDATMQAWASVATREHSNLAVL